MKMLEVALAQSPNNVACQYHMARLLFDTGRYREALDLLAVLRCLSPDEAHVFYLLGRVHRKLNNHHVALVSYSWATEIDPRGEQNHSALSDQGPYDDDPIDFSSESRTTTSAVLAESSAIIATTSNSLATVSGTSAPVNNR